MNSEDHADLAFAQAGKIQLVSQLCFHANVTLAIENCSHYRR
jgi:hypothetical protein